MADFSLRLDAEAAVQLATNALERQQLRVVHSFDLRDALQSQNSLCTCPHHRAADCTCNYVVLLAYDAASQRHAAQPAGRLVIHSHDGTTWLSIVAADDRNRPFDDKPADRRLLRAVAELVYEAAL